MTATDLKCPIDLLNIGREHTLRVFICGSRNTEKFATWPMATRLEQRNWTCT